MLVFWRHTLVSLGHPTWGALNSDRHRSDAEPSRRGASDRSHKGFAGANLQRILKTADWTFHGKPATNRPSRLRHSPQTSWKWKMLRTAEYSKSSQSDSESVLWVGGCTHANHWLVVRSTSTAQADANLVYQRSAAVGEWCLNMLETGDLTWNTDCPAGAIERVFARTP